MNIYQEDEQFKKNVGNFILTFSEIEFSLGMLISILENDNATNPLLPEIVGLSLEKKRKRLRNALQINKDLLKKWEIIDSKLIRQNEFRRFLSHGIIMNHVVNPSLQGLIRARSKNGEQGFHYKEITNSDILDHLEELNDINSGKNGLGVLTEEIKKAQ